MYIYGVYMCTIFMVEIIRSQKLFLTTKRLHASLKKVVNSFF